MAAPLPPSKPPLVFVESLSSPELGPDDHHHLARVLRVRDGDAITLADGSGSWRPARFGPRPEVTGATVEPRDGGPVVTIAFALVKGAKPELVVQKLTELGVDRIVLFEAERSVARWDGDKADRNLRRLAKVAREACMQARRAALPELDGPVPFVDLVSKPGVALADHDGEPPSLDRPVVLVGPEGGWSDAERARVAELPTVGLGPHVLRAETAAIAAGAALTLLRSGLSATP